MIEELGTGGRKTEDGRRYILARASRPRARSSTERALSLSPVISLFMRAALGPAICRSDGVQLARPTYGSIRTIPTKRFLPVTLAKRDGREIDFLLLLRCKNI